MEAFVALGLTQGSILGGSTCWKVMGQNPGLAGGLISLRESDLNSPLRGADL